MTTGLWSFIEVFVLSSLLTIGFRVAAVRLGLVDVPDGRKLHEGHVPLCGGLAIFSAFAIAVAFIGEYSVPWNLALSLLLLAACGAADDRWALPVAPRLLIHFLAAGVIVAPAVIAGVNLGTFLDLPSSLALPMALVVSTFLIVGLINATNMSDGADGLCGGWSAAALFWLAMLARETGHPRLASAGLLLLAAVIGFLAFNMRHPWRSRASVFLGDAGSVALGGAIGFLVIALSAGPGGLPLPLLAWIVVVPVTDMASLIVRRLLAGRSPMSADRRHLHHLLMDMGVPHAAAAGLLIVISAGCGAIAWTAYLLDLPDGLLAVGLALPLAAHTAFAFLATGLLARQGNASRLKPMPGLEIAARELKGSQP